MATSFAIGQQIGGRYRLESVLARGGMGAVYRATDTRLGRVVAIKVLLSELAGDTTEVARFEREAIAVARLHHPSIVQVLDVGREGGAPFLVMEHVQGRTIADLLGKEGRFHPARASDLVEQALFAIAIAHEAGIVHRDLKPGNIMVVPTGGRELAKVLDFGIAQLKTGATYARLTQTGAILGTPAFMAPEQARGEACDARTDIYAMGVLLWCMLTARKPFAGTDIAETLTKVLEEVPARADRVEPSVPAALAAICDVALQKRPADRFPSAAAFGTALVEARQRVSMPQAPSAPPSEVARAPSLPAPPPTQYVAPMAAVSPATVPTSYVAPRISLASPTLPPSTPLASPTLPPPTPLASPTLPPPTPQATAHATVQALQATLASAVLAPRQWSTAQLLMAALGVAMLTGIMTCFVGGYALRQCASPVAAPASPGSLPIPLPGAAGSTCERAVQCCEILSPGYPGCTQLRLYEGTGPQGEAICQQMLASYEASARALGRRCR